MEWPHHTIKKRYRPAYNLLWQASQLSANNANITISLFKVLTILAEEEGLTEEENQSVEKCLEALEGVDCQKVNK